MYSRNIFDGGLHGHGLCIDLVGKPEVLHLLLLHIENFHSVLMPKNAPWRKRSMAFSKAINMYLIYETFDTSFIS